MNLKQFIKFCIVGAVGTIPNYIVYWSLRNIIHNDIAWLFGIGAGALSNYILNSKWVFIQ